jgi:hypothetical protein
MASGHSLERHYYVDLCRVSGGYPYLHMQAVTCGLSSYPLNASLTTSVFEIGMYFRDDEEFDGKSIFPFYLSFSPYQRLVKPSKEWVIARPMLFLFAGGSAWALRSQDTSA